MSDYFNCIYYKDDDVVIINTLTDEGKDQNAIIIPNRINGKKVGGIGGDQSTGYKRFLPSPIPAFKSDNLKKVYYVGKKYYTSYSSCDYFMTSNIEKILLIGNDVLDDFYYVRGAQNFYYPYSVENLDIDESKKQYFHLPNIYFYLNDGTDTIYWFDIYEEGDVMLMPIKPKLEGFSFDGWFTDPECETAWDEDFTVENNNTLSIYAKWVNN